MMSGVECSVVIPTAGRAPHLPEVVSALLVQQLERDCYEIIVVDNNRTSEFSQRVRDIATTYGVRLVREERPGAAAARNAGARAAVGGLLVFVDDDIIASDGVLGSHLEAHQGQSVVGVGPIVERNTRGGWFLRYLVDRGAINRVDDTDHLSFRNVYGANTSVRRDLFLEIGGFDERFQRREDEELGLRFVQSGIEPVLVAGSVGEHHSELRPLSHVRRSYWNGYHLAMLIEKHPEVTKHERMELYRPSLRYASYALGPLLCAVGFVVAPVDRRPLSLGITALVLAQSSRGFAAFRRGR